MGLLSWFKKRDSKIKKLSYCMILVAVLLMIMITGCAESDNAPEVGETYGQPVRETPVTASDDILSYEAEEDIDQDTFEPLTEADLEENTEYIRRIDVYGFLCSEYGRPEDVSLTDVFFVGAGLGSINSLYSQLSQYSSIKSGAYGKLTKAYYAKNSEHSKHSSGTSKKSDALNRFYESKTSDSIKALKSVETESNELVKATNKLTSSGKDGVFADEKGFNMDAAYDAVGKFVNEYNDTLKSLSGTGDASVRGSGNRMKQMTDIMKNSLSKVGISIGEDGRLSVSEENFKNADYRKLKSVFGGKNSYADIISGYASGIGSSARNAENRSAGGVYGSNGAYNSYYGGMYYNGYV